MQCFPLHPVGNCRVHRMVLECDEKLRRLIRAAGQILCGDRLPGLLGILMYAFGRRSLLRRHHDNDGLAWPGRRGIALEGVSHCGALRGILFVAGGRVWYEVGNNGSVGRSARAKWAQPARIQGAGWQGRPAEI